MAFSEVPTGVVPRKTFEGLSDGLFEWYLTTVMMESVDEKEADSPFSGVVKALGYLGGLSKPKDCFVMLIFNVVLLRF